LPKLAILEIVYDVETIKLLVLWVDTFVFLFAHVLLENVLVIEDLIAIKTLQGFESFVELFIELVKENLLKN
jgi:hypothetical protein